jgi:hypothetical protein
VTRSEHGPLCDDPECGHALADITERRSCQAAQDTGDEPRRGRPLVECKVCRTPKAPRGRDPGAASANGYCAHECPGHWCDPQPDYLWPGEEDFLC